MNVGNVDYPTPVYDEAAKEAATVGHSIGYRAPRLTDFEFEALDSAVREAAERMSDRQILDVADTLHETLRIRRSLRGHANDRIERRLYGGAADLRV